MPTPTDKPAFIRYQLPDGSIVPCDASATKGAAIIDFTLKGGRIVQAVRVDPSTVTVRHRFSVWIDVPAASGDGWNRYPDYSAEEVARASPRAARSPGVRRGRRARRDDGGDGMVIRAQDLIAEHRGCPFHVPPSKNCQDCVELMKLDRSKANELLRPPSDWMWHSMTCAHRRIGPTRGACDCGAV